MKKLTEAQMIATQGGANFWKCLLGVGLIVLGAVEAVAPPIAAAGIAGGVVLVDKHC
ncbi:hypothetical protein [Spirosoma lacussanchae]|uniref:hypothetical protein n=1 Tax=Spirosoma lacussanchae TaxID=1884249 RepID=UPI00148708EC|nr:hypothetical protein [Spirosoma lacussanchae]